MHGAPGGTRTPNLQLRRLALYPIELRARADAYSLSSRRQAVARMRLRPHQVARKNNGDWPHVFPTHFGTTWKLPATPSAAALGAIHTS